MDKNNTTFIVVQEIKLFLDARQRFLPPVDKVSLREIITLFTTSRLHSYLTKFTIKYIS